MLGRTPSAALLSVACLWLQGACGTKHKAPEGTETISQSKVHGYGQVVEQGATSMALHHSASSTEAELVLTTAKGRTFMHPEGAPLALGTDFEAHLVDVQDGVVWLASTDKLARVAPGSLVAEPAIALPRGTRSSAIEIAFDGSVFVADADANRIYRVQEDSVSVFAEGAQLSNPRALQLHGGALVVGGNGGVYSIALATGEQSELWASQAGVVALALDHLGYLIVADASGALSQLHTDNTIVPLHKGPGGIQSIAFDEVERVLFVATAEKTAQLSYLALTGEDPTLWASRDRRPMGTLANNDMILSGAEYWPSRGMAKVVYPDDILWGFYPSPDQVFEGSSAPLAPTEAAVKCAEASFAALVEFFDSNPKLFAEARLAGNTSNRFYLWINDYSETDVDFPHELRMNNFWYWQREPAVKGRVPGFWKWETTLLRDGQCLWPTPEQIADTLEQKVADAR